MTLMRLASDNLLSGMGMVEDFDLPRIAGNPGDPDVIALQEV